MSVAVYASSLLHGRQPDKSLESTTDHDFWFFKGERQFFNLADHFGFWYLFTRSPAAIPLHRLQRVEVAAYSQPHRRTHWVHALSGGVYPLLFHQLFGGWYRHQLLGARLGPFCQTESRCCSGEPAGLSSLCVWRFARWFFALSSGLSRISPPGP